MTKPIESVSIVVPVYNEELNLPDLFVKLEALMELDTYQWEVVLINDGSKDATWKHH